VHGRQGFSRTHYPRPGDPAARGVVCAGPHKRATNSVDGLTDPWGYLDRDGDVYGDGRERDLGERGPPGLVQEICFPRG
jgi:hypothetical protein